MSIKEEKKKEKNEEMPKAGQQEETKQAPESAEKRSEDWKKQAEEAKAQAKGAEEKLAQSEARLAAAASQFVRLQADFDNFRRRTRENEAKAEDACTAKVLKEFLPVLDNFDLALAQMKKDAGEGNAYIKGFELLKKQFDKIMDSFGVKEIEALGAHFDPHVHEAVMMVQKDDAEDETIAMVFQKGYMYKDIVLRPAKTQVVHNN